MKLTPKVMFSDVEIIRICPVMCKCNHLSTFASAWGSIKAAPPPTTTPPPLAALPTQEARGNSSLLLSEVMCSNVDFLKPANWTAVIDNPEWVHQLGCFRPYY